MSAYMVMPQEAEYMVEQISPIQLNEMGSSDWMRAHGEIEKLNLQAHQSAKQKADNFVVEAMLTFKKVDVLIQNLLVNELWKENVFPTLKDVSDAASLRTYFVLYHEAVLCNLLEVAFYHEHVLESLDDETMMEVVDYAIRKVTWLIGTPREVFKKKTTFHKSGQDIVKEMDAASRKDELQRQYLEMEFRVAIQSVTILRYICERIHILSLNILTRLLDKHDVLLSFVALIENPPWTYKTDDGKWKKFQDQKWIYVEPCDLLQITTTEAQPWIGVYFLVCTKDARDHYQLTSFRKNQLLRIRKYLNDIMLDQLPLLTDVQRFLDELAIVQLPPNQAFTTTKLVLECVPVMRSALIRRFKNEYTTLGEQFLGACQSLNRQNDMKYLADVYNMDGIDELLDGPPAEENTESSTADPAATTPETNANKPLLIQLTVSNVMQKIVEIGSDTEVEFDYFVDISTEKLVETNHGMYFRYAANLASKKSIQIQPHALLSVKIEFDNKTTIHLQCPDVNLPIENDMKTVWRQAGTLEEGKGVLQVQMKWDEGYTLGSLFFSIPALS